MPKNEKESICLLITQSKLCQSYNYNPNIATQPIDYQS